MTTPIIWYHGTDQEAAQEAAQCILDEGFRAWTWFASGLADALAFGGPYIFKIGFVRADIPSTQWQCQYHEPIAPDRIISLLRYDAEVQYYSKDADRVVTHAAMLHDKPGHVLCLHCDGHGELGLEDSHCLLLPKGAIERPATRGCPRCKGHGLIKENGNASHI